MKVSRLLSITSLALAANVALAQVPDAPVSRAEVVGSVLAARADGTLRHAGDRGPEEMSPYRNALDAHSTLTRSQEKAEVLRDRAAGTLIGAGPATTANDLRAAHAPLSTSTLTRARVSYEVLRARADGTLIPAGQGEYAQDDRDARTANVAKTPGQ